jgi:hypothetical protein
MQWQGQKLQAAAYSFNQLPQEVIKSADLFACDENALLGGIAGDVTGGDEQSREPENGHELNRKSLHTLDQQQTAGGNWKCFWPMRRTQEGPEQAHLQFSSKLYQTKNPEMLGKKNLRFSGT